MCAVYLFVTLLILNSQIISLCISYITRNSVLLYATKKQKVSLLYALSIIHVLSDYFGFKHKKQKQKHQKKPHIFELCH